MDKVIKDKVALTLEKLELMIDDITLTRNGLKSGTVEKTSMRRVGKALDRCANILADEYTRIAGL